uniref:Uncharacterized protein n=1 Tax=uncultured delta proteobacterium HF0200_39N20 TaxID=710833 RepID=E0XUU4_9DELT|nr:hypothetical protein [uncultured delta proteobacterium HF0200_39N20]
MAQSNCAKASASVFCSPYVMVPSPRQLTSIPELPKEFFSTLLH